MKKILAFILAAAMALSMVGCSSDSDSGNGGTAKTALDKVLESGKITCAISPDFAPSEFKNPNTGEVLGSDIFVANYIADYLTEKYGKAIKLEIQEMDFKSCQAAVSTGTVDFSLNGYAATDERRENYYISAYYGFTDDEGYHGFLMAADKAGDFNTAESFSGKTLAVQLASLQYNLASAQLPADVKYEYVTTVTNGAMLLTTGQVDGLVIPSETAELLMKNYEGLAMAGFKLEYESEGSVALINLNNPELGRAIDEALTDMNAKVDFDEIRQQYTDIAAELGVSNE